MTNLFHLPSVSVSTLMGRILFTETALDQAPSSGKYLVSPGDIIYSKIRPELNKACIAQGYWLCSADMYPIRIGAMGKVILSPTPTCAWKR